MDTANYTKLINAAMASIDEKYDFESVGKYTVSTLHGDAEPIVDFEVNVTEHGKRTHTVGNMVITDYYGVRFKVEDGELVMVD